MRVELTYRPPPGRPIFKWSDAQSQISLRCRFGADHSFAHPCSRHPRLPLPFAYKAALPRMSIFLLGQVQRDHVFVPIPALVKTRLKHRHSILERLHRLVADSYLYGPWGARSEALLAASSCQCHILCRYLLDCRGNKPQGTALPGDVFLGRHSSSNSYISFLGHPYDPIWHTDLGSSRCTISVLMLRGVNLGFLLTNVHLSIITLGYIRVILLGLAGLVPSRNHPCGVDQVEVNALQINRTHTWAKPPSWAAWPHFPSYAFNISNSAILRR
ncbi:hypothetical protein C8R47DRAFT_219491 [Mycena vitilis]|nr:hypothetical protein C8R47DRAFT_219491 [Mycena vitilis]